MQKFTRYGGEYNDQDKKIAKKIEDIIKLLMMSALEGEKKGLFYYGLLVLE